MSDSIALLGRDSLVYGIGSVVTRCISLFLLPVFTRYLAVEEYGVLSMLAVLTLVAQPLFTLGMGAAMGPSYFAQESAGSRCRVVWTTFGVHVLSATVLLAIAWAWPGELATLTRVPRAHAGLVSLTLTGCAMTVLATSLMQRVQFDRRALLYVQLTTASAAIAIVTSVVTVVHMRLGVLGMVLGQFAGNLATLGLFLWTNLRIARPQRVDREVLRELLKAGLPLLPSFAAIFVIMNASRYVLEYVAGLGAVGVYSLGYNLGAVISVVTGGVAAAWYSFMMGRMNRREGIETLFGCVFTYYVFVVGLACAGFFFFARPVVILVFASEYSQAWKAVGLAALAHALQGAFTFFTVGAYYNREIFSLSLSQTAAALLGIPAAFLAIRLGGVAGAAFSVALANALMVYSMMAWNTYRRRDYPAIRYEWGRIGSFVAGLAVLVALDWTLGALPPVRAFALSTVFMAAALALAAVLLTDGERRSLAEFATARFRGAA